MKTLRFAPISGAQSSTLRLAAGWFFLNGGLLILIVLAGVTAVLLGKFTVEGPFQVASAVLTAVVGAGSIWTGRLLGRGKRVGAYLGFFLILLSPAARLLQRIPQVRMDLVLSAIGIVVLASIWRELE